MKSLGFDGTETQLASPNVFANVYGMQMSPWGDGFEVTYTSI